MHRVITGMGRIWRDRWRAVFCGICMTVAVLAAGCSDTSSLPPVDGPSTASDSLAADPRVHGILANSCFDCHADEGSGQWNAKLAPSYLFGARKAREVLNFSNWSTLDAKQQSATAAEIASVVASGSMPPGDYSFFHPAAKMSNEQKNLVLRWTRRQTTLAAH